MRIGIDARPLIGPRAGIANYLSGLLQALAKVDQRHEFILYAPRPPAFHPPNARWRTRIHRGIKGTSGSLWLQFYGRRMVEKDHVDLFWGAQFLLPIWLNRRIPAISTVYDLVPFVFPQTMRMQNYLTLRALLKPSLGRAQHVTVISHTAAADLQWRLSIPPEKISVVPPGVAPQFLPRDREEARKRVAGRWGIVKPYFLSIGTLEPRKNLATVLRAIASFPRAVRKSWMLVAAGAAGWNNSSTRAVARPLETEGTVRFLGYVPDAELPWLYAGATTLLFPSLYEGFGMPIIEAMASGLPVITSDIPVTREVAADAAVFVAPTDVSGWAQAMEHILSDERARGELTARGLRRAGCFSFEKSAREFLALCERFDPSLGRHVPTPTKTETTRHSA